MKRLVPVRSLFTQKILPQVRPARLSGYASEAIASLDRRSRREPPPMVFEFALEHGNHSFAELLL